MNRELFSGLFSPDKIKFDELMSSHTTFKTGGPADIMLLPQSAEEICKAIDLCKGNAIPCIIIGNGSNLLVRDKGIRGVVIKLGKNFSKIDINKNIIKAQSGALLSTVANTAYKASLTGMEFAAGIPGSIGGAVCMNAGAYGGEMKDIIKEVTVFDGKQIKTVSGKEAEFEYRNSRIIKEKMTVLDAVVELKEGNAQAIKQIMDELAEKRRSKQPLDKPSAGSTFKRPEGNFAGRLIEEAGLRGFAIGGAQVSEKHCGFVVNKGGATSGDILKIIDEIKRRVYENSGVTLECEVRILGEE